MARRIPAATLILLVACGGGGASFSQARGDGLSYAQVHGLRKGTPAVRILQAFGEPAHRLEQEGRTRGLTYPCENYRGEIYDLRILFDADEKLVNWALRRPR